MRNVVATGFELLHLVEVQQRFHKLTVVPLFEAPSRPGDLKTQKVHGTTRVSQHHHVRQEKTGFHALNVSHEVLFRVLFRPRHPCGARGSNHLSVPHASLRGRIFNCS